MNKKVSHMRNKIVSVVVCMLMLSIVITTIVNADKVWKPVIQDGATSGIAGTEYTFFANTTVPGSGHGDQIRYKFTWGDGNYSEWTEYVLSGEIVNVSYFWSQEGTYDIRVRASAPYWGMSDLSDPWTITIAPNDPPYKPTFIGGEHHIMPNITYDFSFNATDPEDENVSYYVEWGDGTNTGWLPYVLSGEIVTASHAWNQTYYGDILVRAKDYPICSMSEWSDPFDIFVDIILSGPIDGERMVDYEFSVCFIDPEGDNISYFIDWGDGNDTGWIMPYVESGTIVQASHSWDEPGDFDVKVKAKDVYGHESVWSDPLVISITNDPPEIHDISGPTTGDRHISYTYTFTALDPEGDDMFYLVDWDDGTNTGWIPVESGEIVNVAHKWTELGGYDITVFVIDIYDSENSSVYEVYIGGLDITVINGFGVRALIKNRCDVAKDVNWTVDVFGGTVPFCHVKKDFSGSIYPIGPGDTATLLTDRFFSLGRIDITVTAECAGQPIVTETVKGFILFFYIIILE